MPSDKLIGNVVEVITNDMRLRPHFENIIADTFDQCGFPTGRHLRIVEARAYCQLFIAMELS
ncbi:hypothetical protein [Bradyrhizobium sp. dw_411]|uniref:hypothetical protein n=1 Tax=Bradyrhizobium sp. dw_411 TaxID=2720082 RepID=UPI001BCE7D50|nr:hypothetical protein [Bradyrhizobium sp. dw_411]